MEFRPSFIPCFFLFLILALPFFSTGGSELLDPEIYEIDYRGPETHSSVPPPHHSRANLHSTPPKNPLTAPKSKGLMASSHNEAKGSEMETLPSGSAISSSQ